MEFKEKYQALLSKIESRITEIVPKKLPHNLYAPFSYIMQSGGKRFRPVIALISCGVVGANPDDAIDAGVALEILHNFTLVHDDIMDNSPIRRNRPTVHKKWSEAIAILAGDVMVGYAYSLLPSPSINPNSEEIHKIFTNELIEVCEGQVLDMDFNERTDVNMDEYINMIDKKTARLMETSSAIGALVGNGSDIEIMALRNITRTMGIAFQIQDDLLDMTAEQAKLGKRIGNDLLEGKKTYLIIKAKEIANDKIDIDFIDYYYKNNGLKENETEQMNLIFHKYNIYDETLNEIERLFATTENQFRYLHNNDYTMLLNQLINKIRSREF